MHIHQGSVYSPDIEMAQVDSGLGRLELDANECIKGMRTHMVCTQRPAGNFGNVFEQRDLQERLNSGLVGLAAPAPGLAEGATEGPGDAPSVREASAPCPLPNSVWAVCFGEHRGARLGPGTLYAVDVDHTPADRLSAQG